MTSTLVLLVALAACEDAAVRNVHDAEPRDSGRDASGPDPLDAAPPDAGLDGDAPEDADAARPDGRPPDDARRCATEETLCDGADDDCDGAIDEGLATTTFHRDADGDGAGSDADTVTRCGETADGYVASGGDCDDTHRGVAPGLLEVCDGIDNDCDGVRDESCAPPAPAVARFPWNGWRSGTLHAGSFALRPTLRWEPVEGAIEHRVALSSECDRTSFRACPFARATETVVVGTSFAPSADLAVRDGPPVGTRYYWRVRACVGPPPDDDARCGPWSETRYLDVGRARSDVDGDGYSDLLVGTPRHDEGGPVDEGAVFIYAGAPDGPTLARVVANPDDEGGAARFGESVAPADVDADGFDDLIVGAFQHDEGADMNTGLVYVLRGSASGIDPTTVTRHRRTAPAAGDHLGLEVDGGDIDADGDDDVLASGWSFEGRGLLVTFVSRADGVEPTSDRVVRSPNEARGDLFGHQLSARGDFDGDGMVDVVVGAPAESGTWLGAPQPTRGRVYVWRGGVPPAGAPTTVIESTAEPSEMHGGELGRGLAVGDLDADGFADLGVGAWRSFPGVAGCVFTFAGARVGLGLVPTGAVLGSPGDVLGSTLAAGDVDADRTAELLVAGHESGDGNGLVVLFRGLDLEELWGDVGARGDRIGSAVTMLDLNGDGAQDLAMTMTGAVRVVYGNLGRPPRTAITLEYPGPITGPLFGRSLG